MKTLPLVFRFWGGPQTLAALLALSVTLMATPRAVASAAKASELMEQGVYSEETKGDLDTAMQCYRQVVAEADVGQALGAQAQFRLAVCLEKKKDQAAAKAAFEKLVHDFPKQREWVDRANDHLAGGSDLLPVPWVDGEEQTYDVKLPSGVKISALRYSVAAVHGDGPKAWRFGYRMGSQLSWTEVDATSLKPIHSLIKSMDYGEIDTTFAAGRIVLRTKGKNEPFEKEISGRVFENDSVLQLIRCLPLAAGYRTTLPVFSSPVHDVLPLKLKVSGPEKVQVPAGTFDCFKVEMNIKQTCWYSADAHRYLVKIQFPRDSWELASVTRSDGKERVLYRDPVFGFTFTAPAGTVWFRSEAADDTRTSSIVVFDPDSLAWVGVQERSLHDVDAAKRVSLRAFANYQIGELAKAWKSFAVRPGSWAEVTVSGCPAVSCVADAVGVVNSRRIVPMVFAFVGEHSVAFEGASPEEDLAAYQPRFDAIVASFKDK